MADAQVTEEQLARSNEPEFTGALKEKKAGEEHAATAPGQLRGKEAATLAGAKAQAQQAGGTAMAGMTGVRTKSGKELDAGKGGTQSEEEKKRAQVTAKLQAVFDATKRDVETILTGLDKKVDAAFTRGEKAARDAFTAEHKRRMDAYKDKRYSGWRGKLRWVKDKFAGLPEEANQIFVQARAGYVTAMQQVISRRRGPDRRRTERGEDPDRHRPGRVEGGGRQAPQGPPATRQAGRRRLRRQVRRTHPVGGRQGQELVDTLASKYTEALKAVDEEIEAEKEKNKGLVAKAIDAVAGVIKTILQLKDLLLGVLAKAAQAVGAIIKDPIGFLGNLISAVGCRAPGVHRQHRHPPEEGPRLLAAGHRRQGRAATPRQVRPQGHPLAHRLPARPDLGQHPRPDRGQGRPGAGHGRGRGRGAHGQKIMGGGIGGLWEELKDKIGDLKETLLGKITEYLVPTVLIAGITWIVSLLNPASAFIKACKAIIDIVTFIITRGAQILEFVNAILDAVIAIAAGGGGGVPALIENALAKSIPVLIGFLAALLGIGGVADKVKKIFQALSKPVMKAVDWVIGKIVGFAKKIWAKLKGKKAEKAGGKPGAGNQTGPVTKTLAMKGAGHRLTAAPGPPFSLTMASQPGKIASKIARAEAALSKQDPRPTAQLEALRGIKSIADKVERTGSRAARDNQAAVQLEGQLAELSTAITAYGQRFNTTDLDEIDPANDIASAIREAQVAGNQRRLAPIDQAIIRMQVERVMGPAWAEFVRSLGPNVWVLTRESLISVYGLAKATRMMQGPNNPLDGNGLYDRRNNMIFLKPGRSLTELAASMVHEGTHVLQRRFGGRLESFEKEYQAFSVQREFLRRLSRDNWKNVPTPYDALLRCETDEQLHYFVAGKYRHFNVVPDLKQSASVKFVRDLLRQNMG